MLSLSIKEFVTLAYNEAKSIHMAANFACSHCDYKTTQKENLKVLVGTFMNYFVTHEDNLIIKQLKPY